MEKFEQTGEHEKKAEGLFRMRKEKISTALDSGDIEAAGKIMDKIAQFSSQLMKKYPDYDEYLAWHALSGSTPASKLEKFDFPYEDSVERFIREEL